MKKIFTILIVLITTQLNAQLELGCISNDSLHFSCFPGLQSNGSQDNQMHIPVTHAYQVIIREDDTYTIGGGTLPGLNDFTAYIGKNGSSTRGYLSINQEEDPGAVSICEIQYDSIARAWYLVNSTKVDFNTTSLVRTARNCSGGITPWGTIITAEEVTTTGDSNGDGYDDVGWLVEIDPVTKAVIDYDSDGNKDKLWKMGRMAHENVCFADSVTAYYGADQSSGYLFKFVANTPGNLTSGTLYALKITGVTNLNTSVNPIPTTGTWVVVPNTTKANCNNVISGANTAGATNFYNVEDVEINPITGEIYFTSKSSNAPGGIYRFTDNGSTVSNFVVHVANATNYTVEHGAGTQTNAYISDGCDNLTFDNMGNLYMLQDGGRDHIWFFRHDHTMSNQKVSVFMRTPSGSEPTGLTFSPDYRFAFVSIQHPSTSSTQTDVLGNSYAWNKSTTIVIARKEFLGTDLDPTLLVIENATQVNHNSTLDFGSINVTASDNKTLVITNSGSDNLVVDYTILSGDAEFSVNNTNSLFLNSGGSDSLTITFVPTAAQTYNGTLTLISNDNTNPYSINLTGNGIVSTTGIEDFDEFDIQVFPNPVSEVVWINSTKDAKATLVDISGKTMIVKQVQSGVHSLYVKELPAGVYFLRMDYGSFQQTTKIIIQ